MAKYRVEFDSDYNTEQFKDFMTFVGHNSHIIVNKIEHFVEKKEDMYSLTDKGKDFALFLKGELPYFNVDDYDKYGNRVKYTYDYDDNFDKEYEAESDLYGYLIGENDIYDEDDDHDLDMDMRIMDDYSDFYEDDYDDDYDPEEALLDYFEEDY